MTENTTETPTIGGTVASGYEEVGAAFAANFAAHGEVGAGFALYVDGKNVVDIWGGVADKRTLAPYTGETLQLVFSSTKGLTALAANLLIQRGLLDPDAPVTEYWPEFGAAGKDKIPVRWLLSHKAGLPAVDAPLTLDQLLAWEPAVDALAAQKPIWEPGTGHGYHAVTYGWLVGEVIRRVTGRSVGAFVADELVEPLGLEMWLGLPDEQQNRVAPLTYTGLKKDGVPDDGVAGTGLGGGDLAKLIEQFLGPDSLLIRALDGAPGVFTRPGVFNRPEVRAAELPSANAVTTARSLARLYAATIGTVDPDEPRPDGSPGPTAAVPTAPLLSAEQLGHATTRQTEGPDKVLMVETDFGLGYMRSGTYSPYGGPRAFGHSGAGGSVGFADPENGVAFAYTMNRMMHGLSGDPRTQGLVKAVYRTLGVDPVFV